MICPIINGDLMTLVQNNGQCVEGQCALWVVKGGESGCAIKLLAENGGVPK